MLSNIKEYIKDVIFDVVDGVKGNMLEIVACIYILLVVVWFVTYFANGLGYAKFELNSVWQGISALSGAGFLSSIKYLTDSFCNSGKGDMPYAKVSLLKGRNDRDVRN